MLIAPSKEFVASLPGGKIPDRTDFYSMDESERIKRWQVVKDRTEQLGDELRELIATDKVADRIRPWSEMAGSA